MLHAIRRSSQVWANLTEVRVLDPDGWDRRNFTESWNEEITLAEFRRRVYMSTIDGRSLSVLDTLCSIGKEV